MDILTILWQTNSSQSDSIGPITRVLASSQGKVDLPNPPLPNIGIPPLKEFLVTMQANMNIALEHILIFINLVK
jgi:hypothetical protein